MSQHSLRSLLASFVILGVGTTVSAQSLSLELIPDGPADNDVEWTMPPQIARETRGEVSVLDEGFEETTEEAFTTSGQTELIRQRFANGNLNIERETAEDANGNFVNHGKYTEYNTKGEVVRSGRYTHGALDGEWRQTVGVETIRQLTDTLDAGFHPPFLSNATFKDGKLAGTWTVTDAKGNLVLIWQFENGLRESTSLYYNSKGEVIRELPFTANVPSGLAVVSDPKSKKPTQIQLERGRIVQTKTDWYDSRTKQKKKAETQVLVPYADRLVGHDWWNSRVATEPESSGDPIRHGTVLNWYENGQIAFQGNYVNGQQNGEFVWYYENGQPKGKGEIKADAKVGQWTWWHANGMKQASGRYEEGIASGTWSAWASDGQLLQRGDADAMIAITEEPTYIEPSERPAPPTRSAIRSRAYPHQSRSQSR